MRVAVGVDKLGDLADDLGGLLDRDDPRLLVLILEIRGGERALRLRLRLGRCLRKPQLLFELAQFRLILLRPDPLLLLAGRLRLPLRLPQLLLPRQPLLELSSLLLGNRGHLRLRGGLLLREQALLFHRLDASRHAIQLGSTGCRLSLCLSHALLSLLGVVGLRLGLVPATRRLLNTKYK